jgi:hypothetical protein
LLFNGFAKKPKSNVRRHVMKKIFKKGLRIKGKGHVQLNGDLLEQEWESESRLAMIQMLIPLGLAAVEEELQSEVMRIAGGRYSRDLPQYKRWGHNRGSACPGCVE